MRNHRIAILLAVGRLLFVRQASAAADDWSNSRGDATEMGVGGCSRTIDGSEDSDYLKPSVEEGETVELVVDKTIGDFEILTIIDMWRNDRAVSTVEVSSS